MLSRQDGNPSRLCAIVGLETGERKVKIVTGLRVVELDGAFQIISRRIDKVQHETASAAQMEVRRLSFWIIVSRLETREAKECVCKVAGSEMALSRLPILSNSSLATGLFSLTRIVRETRCDSDMTTKKDANND
jgi:hypothetical protein